MYIMHIIGLADNGDNQVTEIQGYSRSECVTAYLERNAWSHDKPNYYERLSNARLLVDYDEEVCILQSITSQVITARWVWKNVEAESKRG